MLQSNIPGHEDYNTVIGAIIEEEWGKGTIMFGVEEEDGLGKSPFTIVFERLEKHCIVLLW